jgi:anti-sigma-K factor RskA
MDINSYISSGIIELYVLGICGEEEKNELEDLRQHHPALNEAIKQYEKTLEESLMNNGTMPPASVDEKVLHSLQALQTPVIELPVSDNIKRKQLWTRPVAAAAILLLVISGVFNYTLYKKLRKQETALQSKNTDVVTLPAPTLPASDYSILTNPTITPVAMYGVGTHAICRCTMFWDKRTGKMYIMIHHLPQSSASRDYQLWAMVNDKPVSVGIVKDEIRGRFSEMPDVPAGATAFTITLEKAGGNTLPTETEIYLSGSI